MPKEIKAFQCDFCSRKAITKRTIAKHEKICWHNPVNKTCWTCRESVMFEGKCNNELDYIVTNCPKWGEQ